MSFVPYLQEPQIQSHRPSGYSLGPLKARSLLRLKKQFGLWYLVKSFTSTLVWVKTKIYRWLMVVFVFKANYNPINVFLRKM